MVRPPPEWHQSFRRPSPYGTRTMGKEGTEMGDKVFNVLSAIVTVALVTTIVAHPNTAEDIKAMGTAFSGSIRAAQGYV